jgi:hypothetical protein
MIRLRHRHFFDFVPLFFGWYVPRYDCAIFGLAAVPLDFGYRHVGYLRLF